MSESELKRKIADVFKDTTLSAQEKSAKICKIRGLAVVEQPAPSPTRPPAHVPEYPAFLRRLVGDKEAADLFESQMDCSLEESCWGDAMEVGDAFGWLLEGDDQVIRFARQGCGSIFGFLVGHSGGVADNLDTPIVWVSSEGQCKMVARSWIHFLQSIVSLAPHFNDAICCDSYQARDAYPPRNDCGCGPEEHLTEQQKRYLEELLGFRCVSVQQALADVFEHPNWSPREDDY